MQIEKPNRMKSLIIIAVICAVAYAAPPQYSEGEWMEDTKVSERSQRQGGQLRQDRQQAPARNINITGMQKTLLLKL